MTTAEKALTQAVVKLLALYVGELERRFEVLRRLDRIDQILSEIEQPRQLRRVR